MQKRNLIIIAAAAFLGLIAVFLANAFFSGVETRQNKLVEQNKMSQIVVAAQGLEFGSSVNSQNVRLVAWPANSIPEGAFTSIGEATNNRVALRPIVFGEPILASKVSGANGRATLSANLPVGQVAYSIPISDAGGVAGFVRPGDTVNVILTRQIPGEGSQAYDKMTDVVLEAVPVLGIDQVADEKKTEPVIGKTATLQVDSLGAQKLALSTQLGVLSLALRNVADVEQGYRPTVTRRDISKSNYFIASRDRAGAARVPAMVSGVPLRAGQPSVSTFRPSGPTMTVVRGTKTSQEEVLRGY